MAMSQAAAKAEEKIGHGDNARTVQDVTNPARNREKYGDPNETSKPNPSRFLLFRTFQLTPHPQ